MKRFKGMDIFFLTSTAVFAALMVFILISFINGLNSSSYLLMANEGSAFRKVSSRYQYKNNLRGVILTTSLIISALALFLMAVYSMIEPKKKKRQDQVEKVKHLTGEQSAVEVSGQEGLLQMDSDQESPADQPPIPVPQQGAATLADAAPNNVIYGHGEIDASGMREFVATFPDSAIKFAFQSNINGTDLPDGTKDLHRKWSERGLNRIEVKKEIQNVLQWEVLDNTGLKEMSVELKRTLDGAKS